MGSAAFFAGFWRRLLAYLLDSLLLFGVQISVATGVILMAPHDTRAIANLVPVSAAIAWAYFALMESSPLGATVGKLALGLYVTDSRGDRLRLCPDILNTEAELAQVAEEFAAALAG